MSVVDILKIKPSSSNGGSLELSTSLTVSDAFVSVSNKDSGAYTVCCFVLEISHNVLVPKPRKWRGRDRFSEQRLSKGLTLQLHHGPGRQKSKGEKDRECKMP